MTQHHFVPVHTGGHSKSEESRLTEFDRDLSSILAPPSFGPHVSIMGNPLARVDNRSDFKIVYVSGGEDVLINGDQENATGKNSNDASPRGTMFAALFLFLGALFAKIFHGLNRCRPISAPQRPQEASFSAIEVERIEEELRKAPKKVQKPNAPVY